MRLLLLLLLLVAAPAHADPPEPIACSQGRFGPRHCVHPATFAADICAQIEDEAALHGLPPAFLARLLWQESRFDPNAVSPMRAMGIAQFITGTARLRGLRDPFNPAEAIEASAEYLGEMARRYGSLGLAAIGYNGGERRAEGWLAGSGGLARETADYVRIVTGKTAEIWRDAPPEGATFALDGEVPFRAACEAMAAERRVTPLTPPPPRLSPWGVQVGYGTSEAGARAAWDALRPACRTAGAGVPLEVVPQSRRGRARTPILAARLGAGDRTEALRLCRAISEAGCLCRAYRN